MIHYEMLMAAVMQNSSKPLPQPVHWHMFLYNGFDAILLLASVWTSMIYC